MVVFVLAKFDDISHRLIVGFGVEGPYTALFMRRFDEVDVLWAKNALIKRQHVVINGRRFAAARARHLMKKEVDFDFSGVGIHVNDSCDIMASRIVSADNDDLVTCRVFEHLRIESRMFVDSLSFRAQDTVELILIAVFAVTVVIVDSPKPLIVGIVGWANMRDSAEIGAFAEELAYMSIASGVSRLVLSSGSRRL